MLDGNRGLVYWNCDVPVEPRHLPDRAGVGRESDTVAEDWMQGHMGVRLSRLLVPLLGVCVVEPPSYPWALEPDQVLVLRLRPTRIKYCRPGGACDLDNHGHSGALADLRTENPNRVWASGS